MELIQRMPTHNQTKTTKENAERMKQAIEKYHTFTVRRMCDIIS